LRIAVTWSTTKNGRESEQRASPRARKISRTVGKLKRRYSRLLITSGVAFLLQVRRGGVVDAKLPAPCPECFALSSQSQAASLDTNSRCNDHVSSDASQRGRLLKDVEGDSLRTMRHVARKTGPLKALLPHAGVRDRRDRRSSIVGLISDITDQKVSLAALRHERDSTRVLNHTQISSFDAGQIGLLNHGSGNWYSQRRSLGLTALAVDSHFTPPWFQRPANGLDTGAFAG